MASAAKANSGGEKQDLASHEFANFDEFFAFYLTQHSDARNRALHACGTAAGAAVVIAALAMRRPWWTLAWAPVSYGFAWFGHFVVEGNRPATFGHPWWAFVSDFRMLWWMVRGRSD